MRGIFLLLMSTVLFAACAGTPPTMGGDTGPVAAAAPSSPSATKPAPATTWDLPQKSPTAPPAKQRQPKLDRDRAIYFPTASFDVSEDGMKTLRKYAERLNSDRRLVVMLIGSSDEHGSKEMCVAIANKRTIAVEDELLNLGVRPQQIRKYARGCETVSDLSCVADTCRQQYRRVDLRIDS